MWGHIKEMLFKDNLEELKKTVRAAMSGIPQETYARVAEEAKRRLICARPETRARGKAINVRKGSNTLTDFVSQLTSRD